MGKLFCWIHLEPDVTSLGCEVTEDGQAVLDIEGNGWLLELYEASPGELVRRLREVADELEHKTKKS